MAERNITARDLTTLRWIDVVLSELERVGWTDTPRKTAWWRIVAEMSCCRCGAYQAADSDPTNDKQVATTLAVGLFNKVGWRVDELKRVVCRDCVQRPR